MGKIIYIMGKSSTGKDTIYKKLLERNPNKFDIVVPYTTRPIRSGEREGVEYHFTDEAGYAELKTAGKIIEAREYNTCHGLWRYFTADDGQIQENGTYLIIGTLEGYQSLKKYFGAEKLLPVLIELDDGVRLQRALDREKNQKEPKYEELCRRYLADSADFNAEKIREAEITIRFENNDLDHCLEEIEGYIEQSLS